MQQTTTFERSYSVRPRPRGLRDASQIATGPGRPSADVSPVFDQKTLKGRTMYNRERDRRHHQCRQQVPGLLGTLSQRRGRSKTGAARSIGTACRGIHQQRSLSRQLLQRQFPRGVYLRRTGQHSDQRQVRRREPELCQPVQHCQPAQALRAEGRHGRRCAVRRRRNEHAGGGDRLRFSVRDVGRENSTTIEYFDPMDTDC